MGADANIVACMIVAAIIIAAFLIGQVWQAIFDPMPDCIEDAKPGTMLIHFDRDGEKRLKREECTETDVYYIEELASDWLAGRHCVRVELKSVEAKIYVFTPLSIKRKGW